METGLPPAPTARRGPPRPRSGLTPHPPNPSLQPQHLRSPPKCPPAHIGLSRPLGGRLLFLHKLPAPPKSASRRACSPGQSLLPQDRAVAPQDRAVAPQDRAMPSPRADSRQPSAPACPALQACIPSLIHCTLRGAGAGQEGDIGNCPHPCDLSAGGSSRELNCTHPNSRSPSSTRQAARSRPHRAWHRQEPGWQQVLSSSAWDTGSWLSPVRPCETHSRRAKKPGSKPALPEGSPGAR